MTLSEAERKERRETGRQRELSEMSVARRVQRDLTNGRPPASEFKTPTGALIAAKTLCRKIEMQIADETHGTGLKPRSFAVSIGFVSPDLSVLGFTPLLVGYSPAFDSADEARIERALAGEIAIGLVFGIEDGEEILMGARPFIVMKQTDAWLEELIVHVRSEIELDSLERQ